MYVYTAKGEAAEKSDSFVGIGGEVFQVSARWTKDADLVSYRCRFKGDERQAYGLSHLIAHLDPFQAH